MFIYAATEKGSPRISPEVRTGTADLVDCAASGLLIAMVSSGRCKQARRPGLALDSLRNPMQSKEVQFPVLGMCCVVVVQMVTWPDLRCASEVPKCFADTPYLQPQMIL